MICVTSRNRTRNPRGAGDRLRSEIVSAAAELIAENGREGLSLRAIARRVGITAPAIYAHFDDLDAVRDAVVRDTFGALTGRLAASTQAASDAVGRLRAMCRAYVAFGREHPMEYAVLFSRPIDPPAAHPRKTIDTMEGAEAFGLLVEAIRACARAGTSQSTQPEADAIALWVGLHGYVGLREVLPGFPWPPDDGMLEALVDRLARVAA